MGDVPHQIFYFGKLPGFGDFVRYNAGGGEVRLFEQWIQEGLYFAQKQFAQDWSSLYPDSPTYCFVFPPAEGSLCLVGGLKASRDRSGRSYPIVLALKMYKDMFRDTSSSFIPLSFQRFFERTLHTLEAFPEVSDLRSLAEEAHGLEPYVPSDLESAALEFADFAGGSRLGDLWQTTLGGENDPRRFLLIKNLSEILLPMRGRNPEQMALGLRFPLGATIDRRQSLLAFWTRLSLRMLGDPDLLPTCYWSAGRHSGSGYLYLFLRPPLARSFSQLVRPDSENDNLCKLEEEGIGGIDQAFEKIDPSLQRVLSDNESSLAHVLEQL